MITAKQAKDMYSNAQYMQLLSTTEEAIKSSAPNDTMCVIKTSDKFHAPRLTSELINLGYGVNLNMDKDSAELIVSWR